MKEYAYYRPNVKAIRWDGKEETAKEIMEEAAKHLDNDYAFSYRKTFDLQEGERTFLMDSQGEDVGYGEYIVFTQFGGSGNIIYRRTRDEFLNEYREVEA